MCFNANYDKKHNSMSLIDSLAHCPTRYQPEQIIFHGTGLSTKSRCPSHIKKKIANIRNTNYCCIYIINNYCDIHVVSDWNSLESH